MKKLFFPAIICMAIISCGESAPPAEETPAAVEPSFVSPIGYSSKFEFGDAKKSEQIVQLWKDFDDNKLDDHADYFADSIGTDMPGMKFMGSRDSMMAMMKGYRASLKTIESKVDAVISVRSTDKKEDWVLIWGKENVTYEGGKADSSDLHEIWRFNAAGKIDYIGQYRRQAPPPQN